ncbi:hypothetical protein [Cellulosimicrobium sp. TH-20]|uniref:hypothetical protein n=1 Tax=Cellulosimicrobium sp. TH-20 TaxID=1980001 RepID=UPI00119EDD1E|nr:hypothetical protein [Cellulosimicrobium sp. TH-20]
MESILNRDVVVPVILGAVAILATWIITRAYGTRRARLELRMQATRLITDAAPTGFEVTHNGKVLAEPWLVQFKLANTGPRDITADNFHSQEPLSLRLGVPVVGLLEKPSRGKPVIREARNAVEVEPFHLPRRATASFTCLVDGRPDLECDPLVETRMVINNGLDREFVPGVIAEAVVAGLGPFGDVWRWLFGSRRRN